MTPALIKSWAELSEAADQLNRKFGIDLLSTDFRVLSERNGEARVEQLRAGVKIGEDKDTDGAPLFHPLMQVRTTTKVGIA